MCPSFVVDVVIMPDQILRTTYQCVRGGTRTAISSNKAKEKKKVGHTLHALIFLNLVFFV